MSDFLTELIARSVGSAEIVRPRLPSLYEPLRRGPSEIAESDATSFSVVATPPVEAGFQSAQEQEPATDEELSGRSLHRLLPAVRSRDPVLSSSPNPGSRQPDLKQQESTGPSGEQVPLLTPSAGSSTPVAPALHTEPRSLSSPSPTPNTPQNAIAGVTSLHHDEADAAMPHSVISFNASIAQPFDRSDRPPPLPSKVVRPGIAHHSKLETLQVPKHERSAEPTIQVTIGRVEVRAVVQPAGAAGKERSTSVVMSLDEYLRRRARGAGQ